MEQQSIMELKDCAELILAINFAWNGNKLSAADKINTHHQFVETELHIDQAMEHNTHVHNNAQIFDMTQ